MGLYSIVHYADMILALLLPVFGLTAAAAVGPRSVVPRGSSAARTAVVAFGTTAILRLLCTLALGWFGWVFLASRLPAAGGCAVVCVVLLAGWVRPVPRASAPTGAHEVPGWRSPVAAVWATTAVAFITSYAQLVSPDLAGIVTVTAVVTLIAEVLWWWRLRAPGRRGTVVRVVAVAAAIGIGISVAAQASTLPPELAVTGHSGHQPGSAGSPGSPGSLGAVDVAALTGTRPDPSAVVHHFTLTAQPATIPLSSGQQVSAWTFNGTIPGPELRVTQGDLVEVTLHNELPDAGVTVHWHGVDVPNAMDGVAGVTQDAVPPGGTFVYRFVAAQAGTYWYHSHQQSSEQVRRGLYGAFIVTPRDQPQPDAGTVQPVDDAILRHRWGSEEGVTTLGLDAGLQARQVDPGRPVRLRLINAETDPATFTLTGTTVRVAAIDGTDIHQPADLPGTRILLGGGSRADLIFTMPTTPVVLRAGTVGIVYSPDGRADTHTVAVPAQFDPATYGTLTATTVPTGGAPDRHYTLRIDERLRFYDGRFVVGYTLNDALYPDTPVLQVTAGDLVDLTIINRSGLDHPMHLHGHHALVLQRDGRPTTGSPWWVDTLNVAPGQTYRIRFRADNPGIWMEHCHNLEHAADGMTLHLAYTGVTTTFHTGGITANQPE
ncbi:multicopper oxidase family protein [Dactylosporangium cerinum]|uniref:Copper-containing nitrite reductase n=1 Tax=Dactylosporangium cerinum TaxID=1434730 RepID=A0ABV9W3U9_9ACTN